MASGPAPRKNRRAPSPPLPQVDACLGGGSPPLFAARQALLSKESQRGPIRLEAGAGSPWRGTQKTVTVFIIGCCLHFSNCAVFLARHPRSTPRTLPSPTGPIRPTAVFGASVYISKAAAQANTSSACAAEVEEK